MKEMRAVLARQRQVLTRLLLKAAILPADAETLLLDVLIEIEDQGAPCPWKKGSPLMKKPRSEVKDLDGQVAMEAEIEHTVGRLVESCRDFLFLLVRLSREHGRSGGPQ